MTSDKPCVMSSISIISSKGGRCDRKSLKFYQQQQGGKKRFLIIDFLVAKRSKKRCLKLPQVFFANNNLEKENQCLNDLITQFEEKKALIGNSVVARWILEEIRL